MRFSLFIIVLILLIQTSAAVEIKDIHVQISNTRYELNETKAELSKIDTESNIYFSDVKDLQALSAELEYLKNQFEIMEYRFDDSGEMRTRLYEIYLGALKIELKSKSMRSDINIARAKKLISLSTVKVDAARQVSSPGDSNLQNSQAALYESIRLVSQAENITVILPMFSSENIE